MATALGTLIAGWLIKRGVGNADAASLAEGIGALVVPAVSVAFSMLDVKKVDAQVKGTAAAAAQALSDAHAQGPQSFDATVTALKTGTF